MAGGTFTKSGKKVRPGVYINTKSGKINSASVNLQGAVALPLLNAVYGPAQEFIEISASAPDENIQKLGLSVYDETDRMMLYIRETLKGCSKVFAFIPTAGNKAAVTLSEILTCTAKYGGTLGNSLKVSVVANATLGAGFFNVNVYMDGRLIESHVGVKTIGDLNGLSDYIDFTPAGSATAATALVAVAATALVGGTNGTLNNADFTTMLDNTEHLDCNALAFPYSATTYSTLVAAIQSKMKYFQDEVGKEMFAVMANVPSDSEVCQNVTNGVILEDGTVISAEEACCFIAGVAAGANFNESNTYRQYPGAVSINGPKGNDAAIAAINAGEVFFSYDDAHNVVIEYDINSLVTFTQEKTEDYRKMRIQRTLAAIRKSIRATFKPNRFDNDSDGWDVMEALGVGILQDYETDHAIHDVDPDNDFKVDRSRSSGDATYFFVGAKPTDSAEKLYFEITTM